MPTQVVFEPVDVWDVEEGGFYWLQTGEEPKNGREIYITEDPQLGQPALFMYLAVYLSTSVTTQVQSSSLVREKPQSMALSSRLLTM